jgi:nicotinate phosphoribosyltransferase
MALLTDLYQLTMVTGYFKTGSHEKRVSFEYFFRELPPHAGFAVFTGLEQMLDGISAMRFSETDLDYLRKEVGFDNDVIEFLAGFEPELDIWAMPEGTIVFPHEPLVRIEGPLFAAQMVETFILNSLNYPTLIATKAARVCLAAEGDPVLEFGLRRAQGPDGGMTGARAAYIGGCAATSNVMAGKIYGIPVRGTHAHSWIMSHESELEAFRAYANTFPNASILLVDTYDTLESGVPNAIQVFKELRKKNQRVRPAIRLDSGDLARLSKGAYKMMVEAGLDDPMIVASNDLDEDLIADLKRQGAKINAWGVGTHLITSKDHPALGGVYKIVAVREEEEGVWRPRLKLAGNPEKTTDPDRKQVARLYNAPGNPVADVLCRVRDDFPKPGEVKGVDRERFHREHAFEAVGVEPLLQRVMEKGNPAGERPGLEDIRKRAQEGINSLTDEMKRLRNPDVYPVLLHPALARTKEKLLKESGASAR